MRAALRTEPDPGGGPPNRLCSVGLDSLFQRLCGHGYSYGRTPQTSPAIPGSPGPWSLSGGGSGGLQQRRTCVLSLLRALCVPGGKACVNRRPGSSIPYPFLNVLGPTLHWTLFPPFPPRRDSRPFWSWSTGFPKRHTSFPSPNSRQPRRPPGWWCNMFSVSTAFPRMSCRIEVLNSSPGSGRRSPPALAPPSGFHPQSNGQTERVNQDLEGILRCYASNNPASWSKRLAWAEYAHNTLVSSATDLSPF